MTMYIEKDVLQPFSITSEEVLRLIRTGIAEIHLPKDGPFQLVINDKED